jgi:hypothetical protein
MTNYSHFILAIMDEIIMSKIHREIKEGSKEENEKNK